MSLSDKSSRFPLPAATSPPHHYHQQHHTAGWEQRSATVIPAAAVRCSGSQWLKWVWQSHRSLVLQCDPVEIDVTANWLELNVKKRHKHSSKCLSCPNPLIELISDLRLWCVCHTKRTRLFNYWIVSVGWQTGWKSINSSALGVFVKHWITRRRLETLCTIKWDNQLSGAEWAVRGFSTWPRTCSSLGNKLNRHQIPSFSESDRVRPVDLTFISKLLWNPDNRLPCMESVCHPAQGTVAWTACLYSLPLWSPPSLSRALSAEGNFMDFIFSSWLQQLHSLPDKWSVNNLVHGVQNPK